MDNCICHLDWDPHPQDLYCSLCGFSHAMILARVVDGLQFNENAQPKPVSIELRNAGRIPVLGGDLTIVAINGTELLRETVPPDAIEMPGDAWTFNWSPDIPAAPLLAYVRFRPAHAREPQTLGRVGLRLPLATLTLLERSIVVSRDVLLSENTTVALTLCLARGLMARPQNIEIEGAGLSQKDLLVVLPAGSDLLTQANDRYVISLSITPPLRDQLLGNPSGLDLTLRFSLSSNDINRIPFRLTPDTPASLRISVPLVWHLQAGRGGHVFVTITNVGGIPARVTEMALELAMPPQGATQSITCQADYPADGFILEPAGERVIRMKLSAQPERPRIQRGEVRVMEEGCGVPAIARASVTIITHPHRKFGGLVAVDFGTTETAVSIRRQDLSSRAETFRLDAPSPYLPTAIAYRIGAAGKLEQVIGREALSCFGSDQGDTQVFEGLKWRMDEADPVFLPDGTDRQMLEIVGDYLRNVKTFIEEEVTIGANVTGAVVTVPSRFSPTQMRALLEAFELAGLEPQPLEIAGARVLASESWAPASLALPLTVTAEWAHRAFNGPLLPDVAAGNVFGLITFDMGGGSTDVSAFRLAINDHSDVVVEEVFTDGSNAVSGNVISSLLTRALMPSLRAAMLRRLVLESDVPIVPYWQRWAEPEADTLAATNGHALARLVLTLQSSLAFARLGDFDALDNAVIHTQIQRIEADLRADARLPDLEFTDRAGRPHRFSWVGDDLSLDLQQFLTAFATGPGQAARTLIRNAVTALNRYPGRRDTRIVMSGRGSLFPFISSALNAELKSLDLNSAEVRVRMSDEMLKPITSLGALILADVLPHAPNIRFSSGQSGWFGFQGAPDATSGDFTFISLGEGMPKDSPMVAPLPGSWSGRFRLILGMARDQSGTLGTAGFKPYFSSDVSLKKSGGAARFVRVEADGELALRIGVVEADGTEQALTASEWLFEHRIGLLPAGYHRRNPPMENPI
ncbi:Hsp70 family protein [Niveispirillum sp.]|uniref:Hsp70 family protein n=1 Tax=Niveispirillum sp. TaxID=1917217 RepID=UPI001B64FD6B|nr:Hsp70 family protein [Niveispirillum sp.]MBP7335167.1 Hsp70 family protein [Niveispirillum sp.]